MYLAASKRTSMIFCACGNPAETFGGQCDRCASLQMLGLAPTATEEEIQSTYFTLVRVWHPDRFEHDPKLLLEAEEKLKEINAAHDYLLAHPASEVPRPAPHHPRPAPQKSPAAPSSSSDHDSEEQESVRKPVSLRHLNTLSAVLLRVAFLLIAVAVASVLWIAGDSLLSSNPGTANYWADFKAQTRNTLAENSSNFLPSRTSPQEQQASPPATPPAPPVTRRTPRTQISPEANPKAVQTPHPYVTSGLTPLEVLAVLGKPSSSIGDKMFYQGSEIDFKNGLVSGWKIDPKSPIRVKLWPESPPVPGLSTFSISSSKSDVVALQGTPTLFSENKFGYGNSFVFFENDRVVSWKDDPASPRLRVPH
jgi:hypothetical protein